MSWVFITILSTFLYASVNHVDKYLIEKYFKGQGVGSLIIYSSLFAIAIIPLALFLDPTSLSFPIKDSALLISAGIIGALSILFYLHALKDQETSLVVPIFQSIPIFGFILGYIILAETLSKHQILGGLIIILGSAALSLEFSEEKRRGLKWKPLTFMLIASFLFALQEIMFKFVATGHSFWASVFWTNVGLLVFGLATFLFVKKYRQSFISTFKENKSAIVGVNLISESITLTGDTLLKFALLLAPVAMVQTLFSYQPAIVFIIGVILTLFFPKFATEKLSRRHLIHKIIALFIIIFGSFILAS